MGREIKRVPLDFDFPLEESYHDAQYEKHLETCSLDHDESDCSIDYEPPKGDGWQLWQTVSDGPITPVFATPDELIEYMCQPDGRPSSMPWARGWRRETAEKFVRGRGWAPSMVVEFKPSGETTILSGVDFVTRDGDS